MGKAAVRKWGVFVLLLAAFFFAGAAQAEVMSFGPLTVDVPDDWDVEETEGQLTFAAPDESAALTIIVDTLDGASVEDMANAMAQQLGGGSPKASNGGYAFAGSYNEAKCEAWVGGDEDKDFVVCLITVGDHPELEDLVNSIDVNM